ncbi:MAG TPA: FAD-dependent oxidoreductase [Miltoncostaeaceae bacterium]|nr:FAD-dependent oxidoreductase [Miltoncostaeaceae bacterium]
MGPLVVVGGNAAGMSAAAAARRTDPALPITVLEAGPDASYASCGIPYVISGEVAALGALVTAPPDEFRRTRDIDVRTGAEVTRIDPAGRRVALANGDEIAYGALVVATGARPVRPPVPGADLPGVHVLRDLRSAREMQAALAPHVRPRVVLVGSGPIGLEAAEALLARGALVTVVEIAGQVLPALSPVVAAPVAAALAQAGVRVHTGATVSEIVPDGDGLAVVADGAPLPADLVVLGTGVAPETRLAVAAGCALGDRDAIAVDRRGRTSVPGVWAAGDCAVAHHQVLDRPMWMPLATVANAQGRVAGRDAAGGEARYGGAIGSWVSRFRDVSFGSAGLDEAAASDAGFTPRAIAREGRDRSGYMPGALRVLVRLVWDAPSGRLLGAQMAGEAAVAPRLHTAAAAIGAGMTIRALAESDFAYAPPVAALRDPLELAAAAAIGDAR